MIADASQRQESLDPHEAEQWNRARTDAYPVGLFQADAGAHVKYVNEECARILGVAPEEALGEGWMKRLDPGHKQRVLAAIHDTLSGAAPYHSEHRYFHADGREVWALGVARPELAPDGTITGYVGALFDITSRRRMEQALRDRQAQLQAITEQLPGFLWMTDANLVITSGGGGGMLAAGLRRGEYNGVHLAKMDPDPAWADSPAVAAHRQALLGASATYEQRWRGRWYEGHIVPLRAADADGDEPDRGPVIGLLGIALDITDRKNAELALRDANEWLEFRVDERTADLKQANDALLREIDERKRVEEDLRQSQARYQSILNSQQTLVARSDMSGKSTYVNSAHQRMFRSKVGDSVYVNVHPDDVAATRAAMDALKRPPHICTLEQRCEVEGRWLTILWQAGVIRDRLGQVVEYQAVGFDITARREAEELLRRREREALDHAQRALANERRATEAARQATAALEEATQVAEFNRRLAQEVDHRVRNNLAGLISLVGAMRSGKRSVNSFADAIEARLLAMSNVNHLLADANWRAVDLKVLATSLMQAVKRMASHDIPLTVQGPAVRVSPRQTAPLTMVLLEWFINSCKYGAHSAASGALMVVWSIDRSTSPPRLRLHWTETGGPPIRAGAVPSLGTELVRAFVTLELQGKVELRYPEEGADHLLEFPLDKDGDEAK